MHLNLTHDLLGLLLLVCLLSPVFRDQLRARSAQSSILDFVSLACYFVLLPITQMFISYQIYDSLIPHFKGSLEIGWASALIIHAGIDYAWYWNHRLLHAQGPLWNLHAVHHETRSLDLFASQRNSIWSFLLMVYFWI